MNSNKSLGFLGLGVFLVLTLLSFASAALTFPGVPTLTRNLDNSASISISTDETISSVTISNLTDADGKKITFSVPSTVSTSSPYTYTFTYTVEEGFNFEDDMTASLVVHTSAPNTYSQLLHFEYPNIDGYADNGDLDVSVDFSVDGYGDDNEWYPLDKITAKVDVENTNDDYKVRNIVIQWGLYDTQNAKWIIKDKESKFTLDDDEDKTVSIDFDFDKLSKIDTDNGNNYRFYVWATGENENSDEQTTSYVSESISVQLEDNFVILNSLEFTGTASCGNTLQITGKIWNIGSEDQDDVYIQVTNTDLKVSQEIEIGTVDSLESEDFSFSVAIPADAAEGKTYPVRLIVYDEDDEVFVNEEDDESRFDVFVNVQSGTCSVVPVASVTATLETVARPGQEFEVKAVITNTASVAQTLSLELSGYTNWASLVSMDKNSVALNAGESQVVSIKLKANDDASGENSFNIVLKQGTKTLSQPVSVPIEKTGPSITGLFAGLGGNTYLWVIGALNVLLVFVIIVVAIRVVRKK